MPYFPKTKILYIHIPKCYGTSVEDVLIQSSDMTLHAANHPPFKKGKNRPVSAKHTWPQHYTFEEIQNYNIDVTFSFATVRNPYARVISQWKYQIIYKSAFPKKKIVDDFDLWIKDLYNRFLNGKLKEIRHDWPQTDYIFNNKDELLVDKIIPCETLTHINNIKIKHLNKSSAKNKVNITEDIANMIYKIYERDFKLLGYSKNIKDMYNPPI